MRKILLLVSVLMLVAICQAKVITDSIHSNVLGESVKFNVYLPKGYDAASDRKYPVLYLLHGFTDTYSAWVEKGRVQEIADELIQSREICPMIIIMPNAGGPKTKTTWNGYFNMPGWNYEDFFYQELIPQAESRYHIYGDKQHRAISGLSMGGGGSVIYAQRHTDMFSSCYGMSAWMDCGEVKVDPADKATIVQQSVHEKSALTFLREADEEICAKLRSVRWYLDCGDDDFLLYTTMDVYKEMRNKRIPCELRIRNGGHTWEYWHTALRMSLPFASNAFHGL